MISEEDFRQKAWAFLEEHLPRVDRARTRWGLGSDRIPVFQEKSPEYEAQELADAKSWQRKLFDAGFGWLGGAREHGGAELPAAYQKIWGEVTADFDTPSLGPLGMGLGIVGPTLAEHATDEVRSRYLTGIYTGEVVACQLFSEPDAGSDLASVRTKAVETPAGWRVNGQKVWTSGAHYADLGLLLCRTDPDQPRHRGLSVLLVDMHSEGVDVRPLRMMTGGSSFNEVYLSDVKVPADHLVGNRRRGWDVVRETLAQERRSMGAGVTDYGLDIDLTRLRELLHRTERESDPLARQAYARVHIAKVIADLTTRRLTAGAEPGPALPLVKLLTAQTFDVTADFVSEVLGPALVADTGEWGTYAWSHAVLAARGLHLAGGTDEIVKTLLAETVLGLPREPAPAKEKN